MKVTDPVCGMTIEQESAVATATHEGKNYYFCSESCRAAFVERPQHYVKRS
jgi:Cu+-exporting ATPase